MDDIENVKQGLKHCSDRSRCNDGCPYSNIIKDQNEGMDSCTTQLASDALSVIESLQSENKILSENCDGLSKQRDDFAQTIHEQKMEIERLGEIAARDCDICANKMLKDERRWIPVSERLPEDGSDILAYYDNGIETRIIACNYYKGEWCDCVFNTETVFKYITHWMPLPKPPKEGEQG